jgi:hypothetical protein
MTTIIPGYTSMPDGSMRWMPIPRQYSPPALNPNVVYSMIWLPEHLPEGATGIFIGAGGVHFKNITTLSGAAYLFLLHDPVANRYRVEIWGYPGTEIKAKELLHQHWEQNVRPIFR